MKHPHPVLAGILNILIPGLGFLYLKNWNRAITYFLGIPLFLWTGMVVTLIMTTAPSNTSEQLESSGTIIICGTMLIFIVWDLFITAYSLAKGIEVPRKTIVAVLLNLIVPGLGFIYIKRWLLAFGFAFWTMFIVWLSTGILSSIAFENDTASIVYLIALTFGPRLYVYIDMINATRKTIKEMENAHLPSRIEAV